jgi:hypothetical protein
MRIPILLCAAVAATALIGCASQPPLALPVTDGETWEISRSDLRGAIDAFTRLHLREDGSAPTICRVYVSGRNFVSFFFHTSGHAPQWQSISRAHGRWSVSSRLIITPAEFNPGEPELMKRLTKRCSEPPAAPSSTFP